MRVCISRYSNNAKNGKDVSFNKGETVTYKLKNGTTLPIKIDSELMKSQEGTFGYEAVFSDDNQKWFAESDRIIDWDGKGYFE